VLMRGIVDPQLPNRKAINRAGGFCASV